nr:MAG TPA: hypothetical protein [Caudoviricetes sp.]
MAQRSLPLKPPPETWGTPPSPIPPLAQRPGAAAPAFGNQPPRGRGCGPLPLETPPLEGGEDEGA